MVILENYSKRIRHWRIALRSLVIAVLAVAVFSTGQPVYAAQGGRYVLGTGDQIKVVVFNHDDLSGQFEIDGAGNISLPFIKEVKAVGLTIRDLEKRITDKLKPDYLKNPRVSIEVLNYRPFYIIGQVKNPGSYPFVADMTVVNAIALAGGYTYRAKERKVLITRSKDGKQMPANHNTTVMPGDVIEVPERFF